MKNIDLAGWRVWLIDDVKTSGATAGACARLLKKAGAARVNLAVMAVGDPRHAAFQRK
jgi:predicted amidophosphoribosyltransferase